MGQCTKSVPIPTPKDTTNGTICQTTPTAFCAPQCATDWVGEELERNPDDRKPVPAPPRDLFAQWVRDAWEHIPDEDLHKAMLRAIFPGGLKLSQLEDVAFFAEQHPMNVDFSGHAAQNDCESYSCMDSGTDTDSDSDSDADSSSDSGSDVGDVFDSDDSSDSDGAGDGASANDQCVDIIWAKAARGVWGLTHVFNNKLFFTRDIMDDDAVPMHFNVPYPKPKPKPKPAPKASVAPKPGPKGSTDRNSGWCITGRRASRLSQLNSRSSHACWKAHSLGTR